MNPFPWRIQFYCNTLILNYLQSSVVNFNNFTLFSATPVLLNQWLWLRRWVCIPGFRCLPVYTLHLLLLVRCILSEENMVIGKGCLGLLLWDCLIIRRWYRLRQRGCSCHQLQGFGMPWQAGTLPQLLLEEECSSSDRYTCKFRPILPILSMWDAWFGHPVWFGEPHHEWWITQLQIWGPNSSITALQIDC